MACENQETTFKGWLDRHKGLIFKVVRANAHSGQDQDDLFQEILLQLWISIRKFQGKAKETTWIYRVSLNTALAWKRSEGRKRKRRRKLFDASESVEWRQERDGSMQDAQVIDELYAAIHELPRIDGSIVLMYLDGLSYQEMGEVLGISSSNVGTKLNRAKKQLARLLKGLIDDF